MLHDSYGDLRKHLGDFVICYIDDVLIYSRTYEEHLQHVRKVMEILRKEHLFAKGSKCDFVRTEVEFLGFRVRQGQVDKDPHKIEAVRDWPIPSTVREIRSFIGFAGFYRKFVYGFSFP